MTFITRRAVPALVFFTLTLTFASRATATDAPPDARPVGPVEDALRAVTQPISWTDDALAGAGADALREAIRAASFVALAETHSTVEIPAFTRALLPIVRDAGFGTFAIETGPTAAARLQAAFESGDDDDAAAAARALAETPFSAAFIDRREEFDLLRAAVAHDLDLVGLDQVFMGGARINLDRLIELAPNDVARARAEAARAVAEDGFRRFARTGETAGAYLIVTPPAAYAALRDAFAGVDDALAIIDAMEASGEIYRLYGAQQYYQSNRRRIDLMKTNLHAHLAARPTNEKVLLKFGAMHLGRGYSPLQQLDLGNAIAELAAARGSTSLHLQVIARRVVHADGTVRDVTASSPMVAVLARAAAGALVDGDGAALIDLRALRPALQDGAWREVPAALAELIWRYDVIVLVPEFTAATRLPGIPDVSLP